MTTETTQDQRACPQCQQPLPRDAPEGLCPECLMLGALETMPLPEHLKPTSRLPEPGEEFGGYRIGRELGRGGMGAVFEAEELETGRRVALKLLNHQLDSAEARARFFREGRLAASINHPNSVYVFGTEEIGDMPAIAMEMVGGGTLEERVKESGPLPIAEAVDVILQVIAGLEEAQQVGILHRDIKPGNCFQDDDGTVKIGDFGLSISTEARDEKHLTMEGTIFGTPAFASPEQLRGDELNVRSDIYAVGATLFYLLTGRPAFRGKSVAQLFANVLETNPPSPREERPEIPVGLAAVILRCLEKTPGDRFRNYAELRKTLNPFGPDAPVPAPLPLRCAAEILDSLIFSVIAAAVPLFISGWNALDRFSEGNPFDLTGIAGSFGLWLGSWILYYTVLEGRWGYSLGKAICRIRVVGPDGGPPGYGKAATRAAIVLLAPTLPFWIYFLFTWNDFLTFEDFATINLGISYYAVLGLLFITARRRNGFASVFDLITNTRVLRKRVFEERPEIRDATERVSTGETTPMIGPYHVIEVVEDKPDSRWVVGYDSRLLRKVWIRTAPPGTEPISSQLRQLGRPGRLRWLAGKRSEDENWDAYEFPGGQALLEVSRQHRICWGMIRHWLHDLTEELEIAESDGTAPVILSLERVWITGKGHAKLLDFPAGLAEGESEITCGTASEWMGEIARIAAPPLPLHAIDFREKLAESPAEPSEVLGKLQPMMNRASTVTRWRRGALAMGCAVVPLAIALMMYEGIREVAEWWTESQLEIFALNETLTIRDMLNQPIMKTEGSQVDRLIAIYVSTHFGEMISDSERWNSPMVREMISDVDRKFAEDSVADFPDPTEQEIAEAEDVIGPIDDMGVVDPLPEPWYLWKAAAGGVFFCLILPALIAAIAFRGGLIMFMCSVAVVRKDGTRASRPRCFWRSLVTWAPFFVGAVVATLLFPFLSVYSVAGIVGVIAVGPAVISLCLRERGLQDRIAGTCLVPR